MKKMLLFFLLAGLSLIFLLSSCEKKPTAHEHTPILHEAVSPTCGREHKNDDESSLSHTRWNCQYHIVFTPKYRRKAIFAKLRTDIGKYIRRLCAYKGVEIVEAHAMPDHIHMLVKIPPKISVSSFMGYLKGKSSLVIFDEHANLKYNYGSRHFWSEGYYVSTVGLNKKTIQNYIRNQELEDQLQDKKTVKEYKDPFTDK